MIFGGGFYFFEKRIWLALNSTLLMCCFFVVSWPAINVIQFFLKISTKY
ncbi:hypothetical protein DFQ00_1121 [Paenibacillus barcinonensis]|uniref:Uncharacterized protein n=1 Tax=Paenibacillus barcinonensis TaxID=198119 RepID=A0A2V4WJ45_PAEBA|nr:hypothetical protein DFQ00_1121 [Paenibacillus barcinonensis]